MRIRDHFIDTIQAHDPNVRPEAAVKRALKVLADVRVPADRMNMYPHELSGGMRQRIMIALCLLFKPALLIADEPTTALDVILEAQILQLLQSIMHGYNMAVLLITHNLGLVAEFADRVAVMYAGRIAEEGATVPLFREPRHPYTQGLLRSVIDLETTKLYSVPGEPPSLLGHSIGCPFFHRCGKTTIAKTLVGLVRASSGKILFRGEDVTRPDRKGLFRVRERIQLIYQDPQAALSPAMTVGEAVADVLRAHGLPTDKGDRVHAASEAE